MVMMTELQGSLEQASEDIERMDETLDEEAAKSNLHTILLVIILVVCLLILIVNFFKRPKVVLDTPGPRIEATTIPPDGVAWEEYERLPE